MVYDPFHPPSFWVRYLIFWLLNLSHCFSSTFLPLLFVISGNSQTPAVIVTLPQERLSTHVFSTPPHFFLRSVSKIVLSWEVSPRSTCTSLFPCYNPAFLMHLDYGDRPWVSRGLRNIHFPFLFLCTCPLGVPHFFVRHSTRKVVLVLKRDLVYSFILAIPTGIEMIDVEKKPRS
jgi:hypothetical protein